MLTGTPAMALPTFQGRSRGPVTNSAAGHVGVDSHQVSGWHWHWLQHPGLCHAGLRHSVPWDEGWRRVEKWKGTVLMAKAYECSSETGQCGALTDKLLQIPFKSSRTTFSSFFLVIHLGNFNSQSQRLFEIVRFRSRPPTINTSSSSSSSVTRRSGTHATKIAKSFWSMATRVRSKGSGAMSRNLQLFERWIWNQLYKNHPATGACFIFMSREEQKVSRSQIDHRSRARKFPCCRRDRQ